MIACCLFSHDSNVKSQVRVSEHERWINAAAGHHHCPGSLGSAPCLVASRLLCVQDVLSWWLNVLPTFMAAKHFSFPVCSWVCPGPGLWPAQVVDSQGLLGSHSFLCDVATPMSLSWLSEGVLQWMMLLSTPFFHLALWLEWEALQTPPPFTRNWEGAARRPTVGLGTAWAVWASHWVKKSSVMNSKREG